MLRTLADRHASVIAEVALETLPLDHVRDGTTRRLWKRRGQATHIGGHVWTSRGSARDTRGTTADVSVLSTLGVVSKRLSLTAVYEPVEGGWTQARIAELPAVITAAPTQDEAREALLDALREYLLSLGDEGAAEQVSREVIREELEVVLGA